MGAATSLLHGDRDPCIAGMVLDSPFTNLKVLAAEIAKQYANIPKFVVSTVLSFLRKKVKKKANFDINDLSPIDHVDKCFIPALFTHGNEDVFIPKHHSQDLHDKYAGEKNIVFVEGDHNSHRPQFLLDSIAIFFYNTLQCQFLPQENQNLQNPINLQLQNKQAKENSNNQEQQNEAKNSQESQQNQQPQNNIQIPFQNEEEMLQQILQNQFNYFSNVQEIQEEDEDEMIKRAIEESLKTAAEQNIDKKAWSEMSTSME